QEVFATAIHKWPTYDRARPVRPWLMGIAWRVLSDYRSRKRPELPGELPDLPDDSNPDATLEAREARKLLERALTQLDETKRAAFVLHALQGLSVAEVSDVMASPLQTTYSRLRVAREDLTAAVRRLQRGER